MPPSHRSTPLLLALTMVASTACGGKETVTTVDNSEDTSHDVVIVGAGASGLYAAKKLVDLGWDVTIIEATERYGGRMLPLEDFADFTVELGGEYLVGGAEPTGPGDSCSHSCHLFEDIVALESDRLVPVWTGLLGGQDSLYELGATNEWDWTSEDSDLNQLWRFYNNIDDYEGDDVTVAEYLESDYGITEDHVAYPIYDAMVGAEYGTSITRMGMYSTAREWGNWQDSGNWGFWRSDFLSTLTELYFEPILDRVVYESPVVRIEYDGERPVAIDEHGIRHGGDAILVTVSVAVLRDEIIEFEPPLPEEKVLAFNTIGMGPSMKVVLRFSEAFWDVDRMFGLVVDGPTQMCWTPGLVRESATNNVLVCFTNGEKAEYMQSLGEEGILLAALTDLDEMFGEESDATPATTRFEEGVIQDWDTEPYIRGAYSFPAPGTYPTDGSSNMKLILAEPVDDMVFFGGEATSKYHPATVNGALEGGSRAAEEIDGVLSSM